MTGKVGQSEGEELLQELFLNDGLFPLSCVDSIRLCCYCLVTVALQSELVRG
jgi:hypothetical protein